MSQKRLLPAVSRRPWSGGSGSFVCSRRPSVGLRTTAPAGWSTDAPITFYCLARPEFFESRPTWGGGKRNAVSLLLEPLGALESDALVRGLLERAAVTDELRNQLLAAAGGNPLFLEETIS